MLNPSLDTPRDLATQDVSKKSLPPRCFKKVADYIYRVKIETLCGNSDSRNLLVPIDWLPSPNIPYRGCAESLPTVKVSFWPPYFSTREALLSEAGFEKLFRTQNWVRRSKLFCR